MSIRHLICRQLLFYLEDAINGDELLMKEVWEQCRTLDDVATAKRELREIVRLIRAYGQES